jgi:hypothetical protein
MAFGQFVQNGLGMLGQQLFPTDPGMSMPTPNSAGGSSPPLVDPAAAKAIQQNALLTLGLGLLAARDDRQGLGHGAALAFQNAQGTAQQAMDTAYKHTLLKRQIDIDQKERDRQAKLQERQDRQDAAATAARVASGLKTNATNPGAYWDLVSKSPDVQEAMKALGITPPTYLGPMADPTQLQNFQQQLATASQISGPAPHLTTAAPGSAVIDQTTGQVVANVPKPSTIEYRDAGDRLVPVDSVTGQPAAGVAPIPKGKLPGATFGDNRTSELLASFASKGVALPTGFRSQAQMQATLDGLLAKFPNNTPDEIADMVASGQIDFGAAKKETTTAAAQAGRVAMATNELNTFAPLVLQASAKVPRGSFVPINKLLQMGEGSISDPNLRQLKIGINSMLNAYDQLAARGGTDMNKRAEAHSLLGSADSPEALAAAIDMFQKEASAAGQAAAEATKYRKPGEAPRMAAPAGAINALIANPQLKDQFKAKYGYLPAGF